MYAFVTDRIFWIYLIVTLFFAILGVTTIVSSNNPYIALLTIVWLLGSVALLIIIYHASLYCTEIGCNQSFPVLINPETLANPETYITYGNKSVNEEGIGYYRRPTSGTWIMINVLFVAILVLATLWGAELGNTDGGIWRSMSAILVLLGGVLLTGLLNGHGIMANVLFAPFWVAIVFLLIWLGISIYSVISI